MREIYRQVIADARADGVITVKERAVLDGLRRTLDLDAVIADEMERDVDARSQRAKR
jgi:uncharacterized membrane protein YebE (DUF533 family)